jgi:hypothetical protein
MTDIKWIECFNSKFEEFVKDLIQLYPDDKDFKLLKNSFCLLKMADMKKPYMLFALYSADYEAFVVNRDENFFLSHNFRDIVDGDTNFTDELMMKLKSYWKTISDENKEIIWKYLTLFYQIKKKLSGSVN